VLCSRGHIILKLACGTAFLEGSTEERRVTHSLPRYGRNRETQATLGINKSVVALFSGVTWVVS
jgi:hypothetical protein